MVTYFYLLFSVKRYTRLISINITPDQPYIYVKMHIIIFSGFNFLNVSACV
ncbi:MAG: hypothetical protein IGNPGNKH_00445 [Sodalis sp. Ffu]|nr:MAG: hypothetical protein IGNPGNKH_00445 [Sodalis sp. Ffu]